MRKAACLGRTRIDQKNALAFSPLNRCLQHHLSDLNALTFDQFASLFKEQNCESRYLFDSFLVSICGNIRIKRVADWTNINVFAVQRH
ncbi:MAG: hypothetical protein LC768_11750 [Acidobacteria bacterium]|nr:hypothetical protein [Acidobacteriota bacterium]MCA1638984.1 hypothetical protein [Acidobacteriota bacterium]